MIKWFVYIVFLLASAPCLLSAKAKSRDDHAIVLYNGPGFSGTVISSFADTIKTLKTSAKNDSKVKEVPKPKKQSKPEKVEDGADAKKEKSKRQRRPDGVERPPEIPRRNDN
jgi:hypothetical protein